MKRPLLAILLAALSSLAHAQVTCQTYGNTTNCTGAIGSSAVPTVPFIPAPDWGKEIATQQALQAQAQAAQAQADLARAQAEATREQTVEMRRREYLRRVAAASDDELRNAAQNLLNIDCRGNTACQDARSFQVQAINDELQQRDTRAEARQVASQPPAHEEPPQDTSQSAARPEEVVARPQSTFLNKWNTLDDALADGLITRKEYDEKLSALLRQYRGK